MEITDKTKFGMSLSKMGAFVLFLIGLGSMFAGMGASINDTRRISTENGDRIKVNEHRIKQLEVERAQDNKDLLQMIYEIRESQIRVEGKLDMKMDKYK